MKRPQDVIERYLAGGTWRANKTLRKASSEAGTKREGKRKRLGNSKQRALYKSTKGRLDNEYEALCQRADTINKQQRPGATDEVAGRNIGRNAGLCL